MDRSPGGPFRPETSLCPPRVGNIVGVTGDALVIRGAAPILFWCAAACRPRASSARRSGALVQARPSAVTPAEAGGWGCWGARCAGPAASPATRRGPFWGRGGVPSAPGGWGVGAPAALKPGGGAGGGGGGAAPPPPAPPPCRVSACNPLSPARPPGVYSCCVGCRAAVWVGRGPVGRQWVSAAGGGGREERSNFLALVRAPAFPGPASEGAAPFAPSWALPVRRRSVSGRPGACGRFTGGACRGRGAPPPPGRSGLPRGVRGRCLSGLPPSALGPEGGGGEGGALWSPGATPPTAAGGRPSGSGPGGSHSSPAPLWLARAGPSFRPSLGSPAPPAVVARRRLVRCGCEGQQSSVNGLRGSGFPLALGVSALPPTGGGAHPSVAPYCGGGVGQGARLRRGGRPTALSPPHSLVSVVWDVTCAATCVGAGAVAVAGFAGGSASG